MDHSLRVVHDARYVDGQVETMAYLVIDGDLDSMQYIPDETLEAVAAANGYRVDWDRLPISPTILPLKGI
jgi:hypothetical protein